MLGAEIVCSAHLPVRTGEGQGIWTKTRARGDSCKFFPNCLYFPETKEEKALAERELHDVTVFYSLFPITFADRGYSQVVG